MAVLRKTSNVDGDWFEIEQDDSQTTIPDICVLYTAELTDSYSDIIGDALFVRRGAELGGAIPVGVGTWAPATVYATDDIVIHPTIPARYLKRTTGGTSGATFDETEAGEWSNYAVGSFGLYVQSWKLKRFSVDGNVSVWEQRCKMGTYTPERVGEDVDPIARGVRRLPRRREFVDVATLVDAMGQPITNAAGDYQSGFTVPTPVWVYNFAINLDQWESWLDLDGYVNDNEITIPLQGRDSDGNIIPWGEVTVPTGTGLLLIDEVPMEPVQENGVNILSITYSLKVNPRGWTEPILNMGRQELVYTDNAGDEITNIATIIAGGAGVNVSKRTILNDDNEPVKQDVFLDFLGRRETVAPPTGGKVADVTVNTVRTATLGKYGNYPRIRWCDVTGTGGFVFTDDHIGKAIVLRRSSDGTTSTTSVLRVDTGVAQVFTTLYGENGFVGTGTPVTWSGAAELYIPGMTALDRYRYPIGDLSGVPF
jgi:hypothetical protein